jgi:hypothetical protein
MKGTTTYKVVEGDKRKDKDLVLAALLCVIEDDRQRVLVEQDVKYIIQDSRSRPSSICLTSPAFTLPPLSCITFPIIRFMTFTFPSLTF